MTNDQYHLAQINVGRMVAPLDSPVMAGFVDQLPVINALADNSPGFVWRFQTADGDATAMRPYEDPQVLVNFSVWESVEALKQFTYKTAHVATLRERAQWFEKPTEAYMALWWVPAGHIPSIEEAVGRLAHRRAHGDTPVAFSFTHPFPQPNRVEDSGAQPSQQPLLKPPMDECGWAAEP